MDTFVLYKKPCLIKNETNTFLQLTYSHAVILLYTVNHKTKLISNTKPVFTALKHLLGGNIYKICWGRTPLYPVGYSIPPGKSAQKKKKYPGDAPA